MTINEKYRQLKIIIHYKGWQCPKLYCRDCVLEKYKNNGFCVKMKSPPKLVEIAKYLLYEKKLEWLNDNL